MDHSSFRSSTSLITIRLPLVIRLVFGLAITAFTLARTGMPSIPFDQLVQSGALTPILFALGLTLVAVAIAVGRAIASRP